MEDNKHKKLIKFMNKWNEKNSNKTNGSSKLNLIKYLQKRFFNIFLQLVTGIPKQEKTNMIIFNKNEAKNEGNHTSIEMNYSHLNIAQQKINFSFGKP